MDGNLNSGILNLVYLFFAALFIYIYIYISEAHNAIWRIGIFIQPTTWSCYITHEDGSFSNHLVGCIKTPTT